jgi:hypothetical protein
MPVDPSAAPGGGSGAAALDALVTAELNALAADAQALQNQVAIGDILNATVLPSNGLSDLVNIQGNRVAASLPPTLTPGDQITVQVTGFNGPQILLQILSTSDGAPPGGATAAPANAPPPASGGTGSATVSTPGSIPVPPPPSSLAVAPPAAAFVAASVRPNAPVPPPIPPGQSAEPATDGPPGTIPGAPGTTISSPVFGGIEARLAAARAASVTVTAPGRSSAASLAGVATRSATAPRPPAAPASAPAATGGTAGAARGPAFVPVTSGRAFVVPPQIATSPYAGSLATATAGAASEGGEPATSGVATFQDPLALVRALNLPVTPSNLAAAKLALDAPQRLPAALATLESALPQSDDPRVATLRTIAAFVGKMEPSSPQLATQIAAYVDHVVSGSEPALVQLLAAHVAEAAPPAGETAPVAAAVAVDAEAPAAAAATAPASGAAPAAVASEVAAAANEPTLPVVALAQVVERAAAIAVSLKEQLFSLVNAPPAGGHDAEAIAPSAASALTAVTSVQMAAAQAAAGSPQTMSFSLPMWLGSSYAQAQIAVGRDAPDTPNVPLDGDNFHIAFVLDTKNLGTVAVDLRTVGRSFALSVKTENLRTAQRFGDELSRLTDRLSSLRYQPKSVEAVVAAAPGEAVAPAIAVAAATGAPAATDAPAAAAETGFNERA